MFGTSLSRADNTQLAAALKNYKCPFFSFNFSLRFSPLYSSFACLWFAVDLICCVFFRYVGPNLTLVERYLTTAHVSSLLPHIVYIWYSTHRLLLNNFWGWWAEHVYPDWLAPNCITLIGFIACLLSTVLMFYYDPKLEGVLLRPLLPYVSYFFFQHSRLLCRERARVVVPLRRLHRFYLPDIRRLRR